MVNFDSIFRTTLKRWVAATKAVNILGMHVHVNKF